MLAAAVVAAHFSFYVCISFFSPVLVPPVPILLLLQIHNFRFEIVGEFLYIPIILLRGLVASLRAVYASL